jgi:hypothetical protein
MPRPAGRSWRVVAGLAFVADRRSVQASWVALRVIRINGSGCSFVDRVFARGELFYDT